MPQMTNRKLVGEMSATPIGRGTVYSAMLKICATNRERAARVNDGERQKLQKATKVIDKDTRHNQWKHDQDMDKMRRSLMRLDAFQMVLRENYPVEKLIGKSSIPVKPKNVKTTYMCDTGDDSIVKRKDTQSKRETLSLSRNSMETSGKDNQREQTLKRNNETSNIDSVESLDQRQRKVQFTCDSDTNKERHDRRLSLGPIETVTLANSTKQQFTSEKPHSPTGSSKHTESKSSLLKQIPKSHTTKSLNPTPTKSTFSPTLKKSQNTTVPQNNNGLNKTPKQTNQTSAGDSCLDSNENGSMASKHTSNQNKTCINSEISQNSISDVSPDRQRRRELIEKRRAERQARMETKVCDRGFDMTTLRSDIERKLRKMDVSRQHRRFKRCLLAESMTTNERILRTNKARFDTEIMEPNKGNQLGTKTREEIMESNKGNQLGTKMREEIMESNKGNQLGTKTREEIMESNKGNQLGTKTREERHEDSTEDHRATTVNLVPFGMDTENHDKGEGDVPQSVTETGHGKGQPLLNPLLHRIPMF